ncbi:MAG: sporulation initiation factor Spo0A C-terminal domain-containing protein [Lachnospiraceae bacterium]|nr:sporulation initiation factor Spo0A C-terminal domain-containing protein [Lachnospiraceae bacterium]
MRALKRTTYLLLCAGFQPRQRGYRYLREAVWISYKEPEMIQSITKRLYPEVAKRFETTDKQVERAIRNAIETAWTKGNSDTLVMIFGDLFVDRKVKPTNSEIIKILVDNIF